MDQHPIPQNITGFQFKLIGDMTVKQFVYLAGGIGLAYLCTLLSWPDIFKWPCAVFFGFSGFAIAFMPFEERSLDKWVVAFFKAVYSPTQFVWKKRPSPPAWFAEIKVKQLPPVPKEIPKPPETKLREYLRSLPQTSKTLLDEKELLLIKKLDFNIGKPILSSTSPFIPPSQYEIPTIKVRKLKNPPLQGEILFPLAKSLGDKTSSQSDLFAKKVDFPEEKNQPATGQIVTSTMRLFTQVEENPQIPYKKDYLEPAITPKTTPDIPNSGEFKILQNQNADLNSKLLRLKEEILNLEQFAIDTNEGKLRLNELISKYQEAQTQREKALNELTDLKRKLEQKEKILVSPNIAVPKTSPRVQFTAQDASKKIGAPTINIVPNVITGLVADNRGGVIPDVIIIVNDTDDNPVRAMKTNKVGQFKTITPLVNGKYIIELEKTGFEFDIIALEVKGEVIPPLEIKAK